MYFHTRVRCTTIGAAEFRAVCRPTAVGDSACSTAVGDSVVQKLATRWKCLCDRCFDSLLKNIYNDSHYLSISLNAYFVDLKSKNIFFI